MGRRIQITESQLRYIIENVDRIDEQTKTVATQSEEGEISKNFGDLFLPNMVTISKDDRYRAAMNEFFTSLARRKKAGEVIKSISINIVSSATGDRATNKLPDGVNAPDHDYGGRVPSNQWTTVNKRVSADEVDRLPDGYNPQSGYYAIRGGNQFLTQTRANNIESVLVNALVNTYKIPQEKITVNKQSLLDQDLRYVTARMDIDSHPFEDIWGLCYKDVKISVNVTKPGSLAGGGYWWKGRSNPQSDPQGAIDLIKYLQSKASIVNKQFGIGSRVKENVNAESAGEKLHQLVMNYAKSGVKGLDRHLGMGYRNDLLEDFLIKSVGAENLNPSCSKIMRSRKHVEK
jgi:hypothetical protein